MNFTTIATKRLSEQLPELSQYVTTFADVSDESPEDTDTHMGIFTVKVKNSIMYIPVIGQGTVVFPIECIMYENDGTKFLPVSKDVIRKVLDEDFSLGCAVDTPIGVEKNPSLLEAVVPPRTGKFVYASSRLTSLIDALPPSMRQYISAGISEDTLHELSEFLDVEDLKEALGKDDMEFTPDAKPIPKVVSEGDLSEEQKQEVLANGYTVINPCTIPVVMVESQDRDEFTYSQAMIEGDSTIAVDIEGRGLGVMRLPMERGYKSAYLSEDGRVSCGDLPKFVCYARTESPDVLSRNTIVPLDRVVRGQRIVPFTGLRYLSPMDVVEVTLTNRGVRIVSMDYTIVCSPDIKTLYERIGDTVYLGSTAAAVLVKGDYIQDLESDINKAQFNHNRLENMVLPYSATIMHRDGVFAVDGKEIGPEVKMMEHSVVRWAMPVDQARSLMDSVRSKGITMIKMAGIGPNSTSPSPIVSYGATPQPSVAVTGNKEDRDRGMATVRSAVNTGDPQVVQASIIAQILCNTDMDSTISEYIPDIGDAVDKLGRTLLLVRLNTSKLSDRLSSDEISTLVTSIRNTFKDLGNSYVRLKALVAA